MGKKFDQIVLKNLKWRCVLIKCLTMGAIQLCVGFFVGERQGEWKCQLNDVTLQFTTLSWLCESRKLNGRKKGNIRGIYCPLHRSWPGPALLVQAKQAQQPLPFADLGKCGGWPKPWYPSDPSSFSHCLSRVRLQGGCEHSHQPWALPFELCLAKAQLWAHTGQSQAVH